METLQRLQKHGLTIYRTDMQGTVISFSNGEDIWFNTDPYENEVRRMEQIFSLGMTANVGK